MIRLDKEAIALIIAQNGLATAATLLNAKAAKLRKKFDKATGDAKAELGTQIRNTEKLATALRLANDGIIQYQIETAE